jgi:hypothetical protein
LRILALPQRRSGQRTEDGRAEESRVPSPGMVLEIPETTAASWWVRNRSVPSGWAMTIRDAPIRRRAGAEPNQRVGVVMSLAGPQDGEFQSVCCETTLCGGKLEPLFGAPSRPRATLVRLSRETGPSVGSRIRKGMGKPRCKVGGLALPCVAVRSLAFACSSMGTVSTKYSTVQSVAQCYVICLMGQMTKLSRAFADLLAHLAKLATGRFRLACLVRSV